MQTKIEDDPTWVTGQQNLKGDLFFILPLYNLEFCFFVFFNILLI